MWKDLAIRLCGVHLDSGARGLAARGPQIYPSPGERQVLVVSCGENSGYPQDFWRW